MDRHACSKEATETPNPCVVGSIPTGYANIRLPYDIWLVSANPRRISEVILCLTDAEVDELANALSGNLELRLHP